MLVFQGFRFIKAEIKDETLVYGVKRIPIDHLRKRVDISDAKMYILAVGFMQFTPIVVLASVMAVVNPRALLHIHKILGLILFIGLFIWFIRFWRGKKSIWTVNHNIGLYIENSDDSATEAWLNKVAKEVIEDPDRYTWCPYCCKSIQKTPEQTYTCPRCTTRFDLAVNGFFNIKTPRWDYPIYGGVSFAAFLAGVFKNEWIMPSFFLVPATLLLVFIIKKLRYGVITGKSGPLTRESNPVLFYLFIGMMISLAGFLVYLGCTVNG